MSHHKRVEELLEAILSELEELNTPEDADESSNAEEPRDPKCGYEGCSRDVSDPDERCWQHPPGD